ncbi:hypothetical protein [Paraburkholderia phenazinium]|uniref:Uncharacterized protein n=1 Tax=Paraburkholderia phenazinium TaxID=60549 RepID=A0A1N6KYB7_9BURK|nr:hypothetical protein [Paraburkholderia phenazinium]SIO61538.1 hypothetical protein SAMN05444165_5263 [Paraburkholderia phenazinium]
MTPQQQNYFAIAYPLSFAPPSRTTIDCPRGWFDLLDELLYRLERHAEEACAAGEAVPVLTDIKETRGALSFQSSHDDPRSIAVIARAMSRSQQICSDCGAPATRRDGFYHVCVAHHRGGSWT